MTSKRRGIMAVIPPKPNRNAAIRDSERIYSERMLRDQNCRRGLTFRTTS